MPKSRSLNQGNWEFPSDFSVIILSLCPCGSTIMWIITCKVICFSFVYLHRWWHHCRKIYLIKDFWNEHCWLHHCIDRRDRPSFRFSSSKCSLRHLACSGWWLCDTSANYVGSFLDVSISFSTSHRFGNPHKQPSCERTTNRAYEDIEFRRGLKTSLWFTIPVSHMTTDDVSQSGSILFTLQW